MALSVNAIYECNASATANSVNGGGFNPSNANMLTDATATSATGNSPVVSSASYNFVAGDVGKWLYIKSGTNWTPGWYQIASVASNQATLSAAIGEAVQVDTSQGYPSPRYKANTVAGCATTASPTGGTFTVDYSQGTAAIVTATDYTATGSSTTLTSATGGFTKAMIGNYYHQTTTGTGGFGTVGWYEIVNVTDGNTLTLDRAPNGGTANVACTGYIGGAISLNSTIDDDFFEIMLATNGTGANRIFIKNGSYSLGEAVFISASGGTQAPINIEGYNTLRGDTPTGSSRPTINCAANTWTMGSYWGVFNMIFTGTAASMYTMGGYNKIRNCKFINTSTTASRNALNASGAGGLITNFESVSYRGRAVTSSGNSNIFNGVWLHDSDVGLYTQTAAAGLTLTNSIISSNVSYAFNVNVAGQMRCYLSNNTLYGAENKTGVGLNLVTGALDFRYMNNIIYGFTTGATHADTQTEVFDNYNDYYNNTTDVNNIQKGANDIALNPTFSSVSQVTGTTGKFAAGNDRLIDTSKNFTTSGVVAGRDYVYIISGTGVTAGIYGISSITTTTNTNDTLVLDIAPGTNTTADKTYQITTGQNFAVGTNLKATGFPGVFQGGYTTGYIDIGAVQRQEQSSGGVGGFFYS